MDITTIPPHEDLAFILSNEMKNAEEKREKDREAKRAQTEGRRVLNESNETSMGLRTKNRGINVDGIQLGMDASNSMAFLAPRPNHTLGPIRGQHNSASEYERDMASCATAGCTTTKYGPGKLEKKSRNRDPIENLDELAKTSSEEFQNFSTILGKIETMASSAITPSAQTPTKKRRTSQAALDQRLSILIDQKSKLQEMTAVESLLTDNQKEIDSVVAERAAIRSSLDSVSARL